MCIMNYEKRDENPYLIHYFKAAAFDDLAIINDAYCTFPSASMVSYGINVGLQVSLTPTLPISEAGDGSGLMVGVCFSTAKLFHLPTASQILTPLFTGI